MQLVVVKGLKSKKVALGGLIENGEAFLGFAESQAAELLLFLSAQFLTPEDFTGRGVGKASDHP